jgi:hypothetical protein
MAALAILLLIVLAALAAALYLLGFRLGSDTERTAIRQVRRDALLAERQLYDLTREALDAMLRQAEQRRTHAEKEK